MPHTITPLPVSSQLCVLAACLSSLGCRTQQALLGSEFIYSCLKSEPIMSTDVTDREENKREDSKDMLVQEQGDTGRKTSDIEI